MHNKKKKKNVCLIATLVGPRLERGWNALGTWSEHVQSRGTDACTFCNIILRGWHRPFSRLGACFVASSALLQAQVTEFATGAALQQGQGHGSWQRSILAQFCADFAAHATLSQSHAQMRWQAQHFCKVMCRYRGMRSTFAMSGTHSTFTGSCADSVESAAFSQAS